MNSALNSTGSKRWAVAILLGSLFLSGVSSIINQVVWQRSVGIYLAGAETISSMIVVLVFMLGLGLGAHAMGRYAGKLRNPLRTLAIVELALALANGGVCYLLTLDISESVFAFQRMAISMGLPLRALYACVSAVLLLVPCFLMGLTVPLASEGCQRQLDFEEKRLLSVLFFLNTLGAVLGALLSGFVIMPIIGQQAGLIIAILLNSLAGVLAMSLARHRAKPAAASREKPADLKTSKTPWRLHPDLVLGFALGFASLGFEMYLFRVAALSFAPRPYVFSCVLTAFLLLWSLGVYLARGLKDRIPLYLVLTAVAMAMTPALRAILCPSKSDMSKGPEAMYVMAPCLIPCFGFGVLFTQVAARFVKSWGQDVGRYFGYNTFGSCLGIVAVTLIGFEFDPDYSIMLIAAGMGVMMLYLRRGWGLQEAWSNHRPLIKPAVRVLIVVLVVQLGLKLAGISLELDPRNVEISYYGKDGVIEVEIVGEDEITKEIYRRDMYWDGLWHSVLRKDRSQEGSNNWFLGAIPLLCHRGERTPDACVIGLGTGITAATLAKSQLVDRVDTYEINEVLKRLFRDYPEETMNVTTDPKIRIMWQDGRAGLALNDKKKYDLITQQPLHLAQSGSSCLLSREYMELVKSRLNPGGVFCIYSNSGGNVEQAQLVRATAASVFEHYESFGKGYMLIVSDSPIVYNRQSVEAKLRSEGPGPFAAECRSRSMCNDLKPDVWGVDYLLEYHDSPRLNWDCPYIITDDHPLVEYPDMVKYLVHRARARAKNSK
jgi:spermidine synthase